MLLSETSIPGGNQLPPLPRIQDLALPHLLPLARITLAVACSGATLPRLASARLQVPSPRPFHSRRIPLRAPRLLADMDSQAFGSNTTSGFGSKPAFGTAAPASSGLFGSPSTASAGATGFGSGFGAAATNTSSPFSATNTTGAGIFGASNKTAFGTPASAGPSVFGGGSTGSPGGFGGFGAANNPGLATGVGDPPGTAATPFQAYTEKEPNTATTNSYQNLLFQDAYKKWSANELRLADYLQGRRHGNASGAGAFGVSSGFGGAFGSNNQAGSAFGTSSNTGAGMFGAGGANTTGSGFGQAAPAAFGTGTNTSGGLFGGGNKPTGGVFGSSSTQPAGGLFGSGTAGSFGAANNTTGAFGASNNTAGGLFGANNQANKPQTTGFGFGGATNTSTNTASNQPAFGAAAGTGFGSANNTGSGLFGSSNNAQPSGGSGGGLFGSAQPQQQNTSSAFGGAFGQQQNQQAGGLFGNNQQQKPASGGLFGSGTSNTQAAGGLFGAVNNQQQGTSGFGIGGNNLTGGSLFGGAKPNAGGGLFGGTSAAQNTSTGNSGLFGGMGSNNQSQQPAGSGLFGAANNQQKPGGLFGSTTQTATGSLFGAQGTQAQGNSLFGNNASQQQVQGSSFGGSLLGNPQQASNAPQSLTANLGDVSAYGSPSLFSNVGGNEVTNPGPLATPLNGTPKPRRASILPMYKLAPATASRFATPQKRGVGFSYGFYGTPGGSPASSISSTPGALGRSLLSSGSGGTLSKSMSASNLRRSINTEDSILAPGAFSSGSGSRWYGSTGSKKLVINRDIRSDLFSTPQKEKQVTDAGNGSRKLSKRVSFDTSIVEAEDEKAGRDVIPSPEVAAEAHTDEANSRPGRSSSGINGSRSPELEQVKGNELAIVHEEDTLASSPPSSNTGGGAAPGDYWMRPTKEELSDMNRMQRQKVDGLTVGRENIGYITFKVPVDTSGIDLDDLCGGIIQLEPRTATVYPVQAKKPPVGKGLNVPARITLEHSWPRGVRDRRLSNDPRRSSNHLERLKRIPDTTFESYDNETGVWTFSVEHFTTYGLADDDDDDDDDYCEYDEQAARTALGIAPSSMPSSAKKLIRPDDFGTKLPGSLPGAFDAERDGLDVNMKQSSFLGASSADSASHNVELSLDAEHSVNYGIGEYAMSEDEDTTRFSEGQHLAAEHDDNSSEANEAAQRPTPAGVRRARLRAMKSSQGPMQLEVADGDNWAETLRKSVSPVKRDRLGLRALNDSPTKPTGTRPLLDVDGEEQRRMTIWGKGSKAGDDRLSGLAASAQLAKDQGAGFSTSIDLVNSLFDKPVSTNESLGALQKSQGFPQVRHPVPAFLRGARRFQE